MPDSTPTYGTGWSSMTSRRLPSTAARPLRRHPMTTTVILATAGVAGWAGTGAGGPSLTRAGGDVATLIMADKAVHRTMEAEAAEESARSPPCRCLSRPVPGRKPARC